MCLFLLRPLRDHLPEFKRLHSLLCYRWLYGFLMESGLRKSSGNCSTVAIGSWRSLLGEGGARGERQTVHPEFTVPRSPHRIHGPLERPLFAESGSLCSEST